MTLPAMLLLAALARSDDGIELRWDAPPRCPDVEDVRAWMRDEDIVARAPVAVAVVIEADAGGFRMSLAIETPTGTTQRQLEHRACEELARAALLIVAVALDPLRSLAPAGPELAAPEHSQAPPPAPSPAPVEPSRATVRAARPPPRDATAATSPITAKSPITATTPIAATIPARARRSTPWVGIGAEGGIAWGLAPTMTGTLGGAIALGARRWRVGLGALHTFAAPARFADLPRVGADVSTTRATVRGCGRIAAGRVALLPCGGVELGATRGEGVGVPITQTQTAVWVALTLHAMVEVVLARRVALWLAPHLAAPLTRASFTIRGREDPVWRTPRFSGGVTAGVELRFGRARDSSPVR